MDPSPNLQTGRSATLPPGTERPAGDRARTRPGPGIPPPRRPPAGRRWMWLAIAAGIVFLAAVAAWAGTGYRYQPYVERPAVFVGQEPTGDREARQLTARLERRSRDLSARLKAAAPRGVYIVIDQTQNRLYLKKDDDTLLDAKCSAGSGMVLKETVGKKRQWVFDSPRGRFEVLSLLKNPVWAKPDWAFIEDGEPIPANPADRLESGSLGEYALYFGNGYMIHGTLYERLLGRAVSHGCIRVGRDDLRKVWANARLGMHIYIY